MSPDAELQVDYLIVGAGVSGLAFANWILAAARRRGEPPPRLQIIEAADEPGGYCRTVRRSGFVWDYSGHFFHFTRPELEQFLRQRMPGQDVREIERRALIRYRGRDIDYPFQANIHQLAHEDFLDCLVDLYAAARAGGVEPRSFQELVLQRLGRGISDRFLLPYNEKLYACDLDTLDPSAMGRFLPQVDLDSVMSNLRPPAAGAARRHGYNATFTYPAGGAIEFVRALLHDLDPATLSLGEPLVQVDVARRVAVTARRRIAYTHLVSSAPLPTLLTACGQPPSPGMFASNAVAVYNLGFDRKGRRDVHWMYFPDPARCFYRVGWYDNLLGGDRQSLYVELGRPSGEHLDVDQMLGRVLADLRAEGIVVDHQLVDWHHVTLDPAYVHLTRASIAEVAARRSELAGHGIHSVGRYGGWTYCSIEDNLIETQDLAERLAGSLANEPTKAQPKG